MSETERGPGAFSSAPPARPLPPDPYIGQTVADDIELTAVLGSGAMGCVYRGHQRSIGRDVAVKVLHRELSSNTQLVQRFQREAKLASRIQHAHVVEVYLAGQLTDGALYIVMEYLDGRSLASALDDAGGALSVERALGIALQMCDAVGEAHSRVIVHRDLKPENVMLIRRGETLDWVKVLDFGIAKGTHGNNSMETAAGQIFGTARYISPEGAQGAAAGPASDVYSLATIVYEMLAGRTPFVGDSAMALLVKHLHDAPPPLSEIAVERSVPDGVAKVVMDNLAKDPAQRAPNAHVFGRALAAAAKAAGIVVPDDGAIARMSLADLRTESTLVDAVAPASVGRVTAKLISTPPAAEEKAEKEEKAPTSTATSTTGTPSMDPLVSAPAPAPASKPARRWLALALMFALGVGAAVGGQAFRQRGVAEHTAFVARAQKALAARHYTSPKDENVRDLVVTGLVRWPDDGALLKLRADAAQELVTRAMALHSGGDVEGARNSAQKAAEIAATNYPAKLLGEQYDGELRSLDTPAGRATGTPRVLFNVPKQSHPGERFEVVGHVLPRSNGPHAVIAGAKMSLEETLGAPGTTLKMKDDGAGSYSAEASVPQPGKWYVVFEANVDGRLLRAERSIDAAP